jgi:hypothetical protein
VPEKFEEWIAHPDKRSYADASMHNFYGSRAGWWCTDWTGDAAAVRALGLQATLLVDLPDANGVMRRVAAVELVDE